MATTPTRSATSLCPVCLRRLPAVISQRGDETIQSKHCPEHGDFEAVIWRRVKDAPAFESWQRPQTPSWRSGQRQSRVSNGCPLDCGLCPAHNQRSCTVLVEITSRCNLGCPVCFASSGEGRDLPLAEIEQMLTGVFARTGGCNLQLSGGEPSLHPRLEEIVRIAGDIGFTFVQLNSNGLRLAADPVLCHRLQQAGLSSVFLQFDGLNDEIHERLRGRRLTTIKQQAINNLAAAGIGIVLVPVLVPGLNDHQLWEIVRFGLEHQPDVRGVHFQPISYFGRFPDDFRPVHLTLPEIMAGLESQSGGIITAADFKPPGCEHTLCSFFARYLSEEDGSLTRLGGAGSCSCSPRKAEEEALRSIKTTARQWRSAEKSSQPPADELDRFLQRAKRFSFTITAMAFMDAFSLNLERLRRCCIHIAWRDGRLIPFCAANLTSLSGENLYRREA